MRKRADERGWAVVVKPGGDRYFAIRTDAANGRRTVEVFLKYADACAERDLRRLREREASVVRVEIRELSRRARAKGAR